MSERAAYERLEGPCTVLSGRELAALSDGRLEDLGDDAPTRIYVVGDPEALAERYIAVVGARRATPYGVACAEMAARACARLGVGVVSGAAMGCDCAAQVEAASRGARVVAVLGGGADVVYPRRSLELLRRIVAAGGAVISEQPWGFPPERWTFLRRNRVIAALGDALFVCEAGRRSGTFSTAEHAQEMGREVLAFPGSFFSPNSWGSNHLIQNGAQCLCDEEDVDLAVSRVCGTLRFAPGVSRVDPCGVPGLARGERDVLAALCASPTQPGPLATSLGLEPVSVMRILGALEARGLAERLLDGRYSPTKTALARARPARAAADGDDERRQA